jgi:GH35 family endo-1,4-beta-xylanase
MRKLPGRYYIVGLIAITLAGEADAQTTINGNSLALRSVGNSIGSDWNFNRNGYVGTYINLDQPGSVTISVNASGTAASGVNPRMNIVIGDSVTGWDVEAGFNSYEHTFDLPAGTHFVRTEMSNNTEQSSRALRIRDLTVTGANVANSHTNANALAAANTYIDSFRKGQANVSLLGATPGAEVQVKLVNHEFNFGTAAHGFGTAGVNTYLANNPAPGSTAYQYQQWMREFGFNMLVPENAGKWAHSNGAGQMGGADRIAEFARDNNMRTRMHNLIWGPNNQQPTSVNNLLTQAADGNEDAKQQLRTAITNRINYYVGNRAHGYLELDVYNESYHTGSNASYDNTYWKIYGPEGIASIHKEVMDSAAAAGADLKLFVNEYNVLQGEGGDHYANWYMRHIDTLQQAGRSAYDEDVVSGIGVQYYSSSGSHIPSRIHGTLQNLSVHGLPITLTEWGISSATSNQNTQANILEETLRLVFGSPNATGFMLWGFKQDLLWSGAPNGALINADWSLRTAGQRWLDVMAEWSTEEQLLVSPDGTIDFTGFYGDYEITIGDETFEISLVKGITDYSLAVAPFLPGDFNGDGLVDAGDYTTWRDGLGGDFGPEGFDEWREGFGGVLGEGVNAIHAAAVPEPSALVMVLAAAVVGCLRRSVRRP